MFEQVFHFSIYIYHRDHPLKTLAFFRGGGVKILTKLMTDSSKTLPTAGGRVTGYLSRFGN